MATCHFEYRPTGTTVVFHATGDRVVTASLTAAYDLAWSNETSVSYVHTIDLVAPLVVLA